MAYVKIVIRVLLRVLNVFDIFAILTHELRLVLISLRD